MASARANTVWQTRVRQLLREGYGVEDISYLMKGDMSQLEDVRREVRILSESGELEAIYRRAK